MKLTEKEIENIIHLLVWDNENWGMAGYGAKYVEMNDRCLRKLQKVMK